MNERNKSFVEEVKPMRFYRMQDVKYDDVQVGDVVVADLYAYKESTIFLRVSEVEARMNIFDFSYETDERLVRSIISKVGSNILTRVKNKDAGQLYLERNSVLDETTALLMDKIGQVVKVTVESISKFGLFVDLGNGIVSLIPIREISKCRHYDLEKCFRKGQKLNARILDYSPEKGLFSISRKQAYKEIELEERTVTTVICTRPTENETGLYVEYNPASNGIMDIPENMSIEAFTEEERVKVAIDKVLPSGGFRCTFIDWI